MMRRTVTAGLLALSGCAAPAAVERAAPVLTGVTGATAVTTAPVAMPDRANLRRIGYRNCDGYAMELFAPAQVSLAALAGQSLILRAYSYRGDGAIRTGLPGAVTRVQLQSGAGWRDLPVTVAGSAGSGGEIAALPLVQAFGQASPPGVGHYRLWLGPFTAARGGSSACAMSPVWQFDLR